MLINYEKLAADLFQKIDPATIEKINMMNDQPDRTNRFKALQLIFNLGVKLGYNERMEEVKWQKIHDKTVRQMRKKLAGTSSLQN